jgi:hypothetical protein
MSARPDAEYGVPIPEPYDDPNNWPFRWCTYEQARGFVSRIRAEGSGEGKVIADELGVSWPSVKRAVRWYLIATGQYDPSSWLEYQRRRKAEARRWFLDKMAAREQETKRANAEIAQARSRLLEQRATLDEAEARATDSLHIASSLVDDSAKKARTREQQRRLHAKNRARAGF